MNILGISGFYHDSAACLVRDGEIVSAAEEERFTRKKHDRSFPARAARYCLDAGGIDQSALDHVIFYEKPRLKLERILTTSLSTFPRSRRVFVRAMEGWLDEKGRIPELVREHLGYSGTVLFGEHHLSHAASAYYPSPFEHAAVITADGVGEWTTTAIGVGNGLDLELTHEVRFPHSIGLLYSAFTAYLGFEVNEGEYKVMGMAAYGRPLHVDKVRKLLRLAADGSFRLDLRYFAYHYSLRSFSDAFVELFGPRRRAEAGLDPRYADIAASIQVATEEAMLGFARRARETSGSRNLCMAGGVALNVLSNTRILREAGFAEVWVQPAAGDSGGCIGAATYLQHAVLRERRRSRMHTAYLGPSFEHAEIRDFLTRNSIAFDELEPTKVAPTVARLIVDGNVVGWFQGRMEFGPRALGARSILADARDPAMKDTLNEKIKHRELFRPFAPAVAHEAAAEYFEFDETGDRENPFMLLVARVRPEKRAIIPAVTHVDGTARAQTVRQEQNPLFHELLTAFGDLTGVPVIVNTSFNVRGEPIVCTPAEAFNAFSHTDMDHLVLGRAIVSAAAKRQLAAYPGAKRVESGDELVL